MAFSFYLVGQLPFIAQRLHKSSLLPAFMENVADPDKPQGQLEMYSSAVTFSLYVIGRLGIWALTFSSLRALPAESYKSIDWLAIIPHI